MRTHELHLDERRVIPEQEKESIYSEFYQNWRNFISCLQWKKK